jgi:hypothetical protein
VSIRLGRDRDGTLVAAATKGAKVNAGFIRLRRSATLEQLVLDRKAWSLLGLIAGRARFQHGANLHNLQIGEALVGDFKAAKLTRQEYRGALSRLEHKWFQITTRPTNQGTIAKLTESSVFDLSQPQRNQNTTHKQPPSFLGETASRQPSNNHPVTIQQPLTNKERRKEGNNDDSKAVGSLLAGEVAKIVAKSSESFSGPYQNHIKWPEFARWCGKKNGQPTAEGFTTWLLKQKPEWRNKVKAVSDERGYVLDGKFYASDEANQLAKSQPHLIEKFRPAVRRDGRILTNAA